MGLGRCVRFAPRQGTRVTQAQGPPPGPASHQVWDRKTAYPANAGSKLSLSTEIRSTRNRAKSSRAYTSPPPGLRAATRARAAGMGWGPRAFPAWEGPPGPAARAQRGEAPAALSSAPPRTALHQDGRPARLSRPRQQWPFWLLLPALALVLLPHLARGAAVSSTFVVTLGGISRTFYCLPQPAEVGARLAFFVVVRPLSGPCGLPANADGKI